MPSSAPCGTRASCSSKTDPQPSSFRRSAGRVFVNAAVCVVFVLWTLAVLPLGLTLALAASVLRCVAPLVYQAEGQNSLRVKLARATRVYVTLYGRGALFLLRPFMPVRVTNAFAAVQGPCIITPNHQSFLDLYLLGAQARADLCLVSKHWPYRLLFFFAPVMRLAGYVDVEALSPEEVERVCLQRLREGTALVIFPEGRRTRDGALQRFHVGAFMLAVKAGLPVVPMVIHNSGKVFPVGAMHFSPATVNIDMLEPVYPAPFGQADIPHRAMQRHVRALVARQLQPVLRAEEEEV